jgi:truncated hemoglobin YjbI
VYLLGEEETFAKKISPYVSERNIMGIYNLFNMAMAHLAQNANTKILFTDLALQMAHWMRNQPAQPIPNS